SVVITFRSFSSIFLNLRSGTSTFARSVPFFWFLGLGSGQPVSTTSEKPTARNMHSFVYRFTVNRPFQKGLQPLIYETGTIPTSHCIDGGLLGMRFTPYLCLILAVGCERTDAGKPVVSPDAPALAQPAAASAQAAPREASSTSPSELPPDLRTR